MRNSNGKMAQRVKVPTVKSEDLNEIHGTHLVREEPLLYSIHAHCGPHTYACMHTHKISMHEKKNYRHQALVHRGFRIVMDY